MGFLSGITDFINDAYESVKEAFSSVKDGANDISSYVSDAFKGVYHPHDKTDDKEYKITPVEDKEFAYETWIRSNEFSMLPDFSDYFRIGQTP